MSKLYFTFMLLVVIGLMAYWAKYPSSSITAYLSQQYASGETGTVIVSDDVKGYAHVVVGLSGQPADTSQPMHFHSGSCKAPGAVRYTLTNAVNGKSETTLYVSTSELRKQLPFIVNVHKSATEMGAYVACGDITK